MSGLATTSKSLTDEFVLASPGDPATEAWRVQSGSLEVYAGQRRVYVAEAGDVVGALDVLGPGGEHTGEIRCREAATVTVLPESDLRQLVAEDEDLRAACFKEAKTRSAQATSGIDRLSRQEWYEARNPQPWTLPGPYVARGAQVFLFHFERPDLWRRMLPPGYTWLDPIGYPPYFVVAVIDYAGGIGFEGRPETVRYTEVAVIVPTHKDRFGAPKAYVDAVYLDDLTALAIGREVLGIPKMLFSPTLDVGMPGGSSRCLLRRDLVGEPAAILRWEDRLWDEVPKSEKLDLVEHVWPTPTPRPGSPIRPRRIKMLRQASQAPSKKRLEKRLNRAARTLPTLTWKRVFSPTARLHGRWDPTRKHLSVDGIVQASYRGTKIRRVRPIELVDHVSSQPPFPKLSPALRYGVHFEMDLLITGRGFDTDFLDDEKEPRYDDRFQWDPFRD